MFKWLALVVFAYVLTAFLAHPDWWPVLRGTVVPRVGGASDCLLTIVALLGTMISPYLFFWQASQEAEEIASRDRARDRARGVHAREYVLGARAPSGARCVRFAPTC